MFIGMDDVVVRVSHPKEGTHFGHLLSPFHTQNTCLFRGLGDGDTASISPPVISALNQRMITHFEELERKMPPQTILHTGISHYLSSGSLKSRPRLRNLRPMRNRVFFLATEVSVP